MRGGVQSYLRLLRLMHQPFSRWRTFAFLKRFSLRQWAWTQMRYILRQELKQLGASLYRKLVREACECCLRSVLLVICRLLHEFSVSGVKWELQRFSSVCYQIISMVQQDFILCSSFKPHTQIKEFRVSVPSKFEELLTFTRCKDSNCTFPW